MFHESPQRHILDCFHAYEQIQSRVFTALHCMQRGLSDGNVVYPSVCLSVRPSHACIVTKRTKVLPTFLHHVKKIIYFFRTQRMAGGGCPLLPETLGQTDPPSFKNGDFHSIFTRSGSTIGPSEKSSIMTKSSVKASNEPKIRPRCP